MRLDEFSYDLPESQIAQEALPDRSASRLMVVDREGESDPTDRVFRDLPDYFEAGDVLVVNRSRVVPARLLLRRATGASIEVLYVRSIDDRRFVAWVRSMRRLRAGEPLYDEAGRALLRFQEPKGEREAIVQIDPASNMSLEDILEREGHTPLPPYIHRPDTRADRDRYQTVYAREKGSVAAPTAGLHFDDALLDRLQDRGVDVVSLTLHVGPGTFQPLESDAVEENALEGEEIRIDASAIERIARARAEGRPVTAVGTTATRALESAAALGWLDQAPRDRAGATNLFIYPGYNFQAVDRLITNFHLPRSSLLLLVAAFLGRDRTLSCYRLAVDRGYRFYSYGDAMYIR